MPTKVYPTRCMIPPVQSEIFIDESNNLPETNCSFWNIIGVFTFCSIISFLSLLNKNLYLAITFSIITGIYLTSFCNCFFFSPRLFSKNLRYFFGIFGGIIISTYIVFFTNDFINYLYLLITLPFCTYICLHLKYYKD